MNKKHLCYAVRDARPLLDDGNGYKIRSHNQIEFYEKDSFSQGLFIVEPMLCRGLGGSIHYLYHCLMHPKLHEAVNYEYSGWKWFSIDEDVNGHIATMTYRGKLAGCFYNTRPRNYPYPIPVILSDKVPEHILYVVSCLDSETTSPSIWETKGMTYQEYCESIKDLPYFSHPFAEPKV